jgi:hemerythrin-like domain-containing protein
LDSHIDKEETVLLPVAKMTFTEVDQASALRSSRNIERMRAETPVARRRLRLHARQIHR